MNSNLIIDVGVSEGTDTQWYLQKGFRVIGVEADPSCHAHLQERFKDALKKRQLRLVQKAAWEHSNAEIEFWHNDTYQGLSSTFNNERSSEGGAQTLSKVKTIAWPELKRLGGVPHYMKIDIEGAEEPFLKSMIGDADKPRFISVEAHSFSPIQRLEQLGYTRFMLVNQNILHTFPLPEPALEGVYAPAPDWSLGSGPFGRELPGRWVSYEEITRLYDYMITLSKQRTMLHTWFDCHATY